MKYLSLLIGTAFTVSFLSSCLARVPIIPEAGQGAERSPEAGLVSGEQSFLTETPQPSPTPTIVWFPPTDTPTPLPTQELLPTPDMRPDVGDIIFADDFSTADLWNLQTTQDGRVALSKNELTIAIAPTETKDYFFSLRQEPELSDFYAEITASTSLCKGNDEYGLLIRAASRQDYYRLVLTCNGQSRLERIISNNTTAPQPWVLSGGIPPGAPGITRLGVWASGKEMRFFANDDHLFTISDPLLQSGLLGIYARSVGDNAVTVNFSNLVVMEINR